MSQTKQENSSSSAAQKRRGLASVPDKVWVPLAAGALIMVVGAIAKS